MNFSIPFFKKKNKTLTKYIFGLLLKEQEGIGFVIVQTDKEVALQSYEKFTYSNSWENITQDVDDVLFKIEQSLNIQFSKTIFFIFSHFLDNKTQEIKKPYLLKIKDMVKNLDLEALGYIECYEAVSQQCEEKDEMPLSAIILELDHTQASLFIYKSGKAAFSKVFSRTDNLIDDFIEVINPVKKNFLLPAKIILYDSKDLSDESTKFITHRWDEDFFVQMPRIKIYQEEELIESLIRIFNKQIKQTNESMVASSSEKLTSEIMGFAINEDILQNDIKEDVRIEEIKSKTSVDKHFSNANKFPQISRNLNFFRSFFSRILTQLSKFKSINIHPAIFIIIGVMMVGISLFLSEYVLHKAQITVFVPSQKLDKKIEIRAGIDNQLSELPIIIATISANISESKPTTGKREVGEKAHGEVILYSFDDKEKIFLKGTALSTSSIQFVLDDEVKVASASLASDGSVKLPGKVTGKVTAANIGIENNLEKGKRFSIGDLSSSTYFAINEKAFTGGTRKEVQTVSKIDLDDLQNNLLIKAKNTKELMRQSSQKEQIIANLTSLVLKDVVSSKEIGEESKSVSLNAKATATYYLYDEEKMISLIRSNFKTDLQPGYSVSKDNLKMTLSSAKLMKNSEILIIVDSSVKALKDISSKIIMTSIIGKPKKSLQDIVKNIIHAEGYQVKIQHPISIFTSFMPFFEKNISLTLGSL